ncbi:MAG: hypothetical protein ACFFG0_08300 [Candidatus Thorarchaeota archaeon]
MTVCLLSGYDVFVVEANIVRSEGPDAVIQYNLTHQGEDVIWEGIVLEQPIWNVILIGPNIEVEKKDRIIVLCKQNHILEKGQKVTVKGKFWKITPIGFVVVGEEVL